jgi:hypothetical protein
LMLTGEGHVKVCPLFFLPCFLSFMFISLSQQIIDFGTAKDLVVTDLNGPEFVGQWWLKLFLDTKVIILTFAPVPGEQARLNSWLPRCSLDHLQHRTLRTVGRWA